MSDSHTSGGGALALVAAVALAGCSDPFENDATPWYTVEPERLETIDSVEIEGWSRGPAVALEEADEKIRAEVVRELGPQSDTLPLTIESVRAAALANNLDLEIELIDPAIAATAVSEEEARFEATFTGSARYSRSESPSPLATESQGTEGSFFDLGMNVPLRTGGTFAVDFPFSRFDQDNVFALLNPSFDATLRFSISQPLLRNAGPEANLHALRVAKGQAQITSAGTKLEAIRILADADRAYWDLYAAQEEVKVRQQEYELALRQLETARRRVDAGDMAEIEIIRAESGLAETLDGIIRSVTLVRARQRNLKRLMNRADLPMDSPTRLLAQTIPDPLYSDLDPARLLEHAIANRMELLELELQLAIDLSTIDFEKNQELPLFVLDYSYGLNGLDTSYGGAFDQIERSTFEDHTVALRAEIPLGNEAAKARVQRAILNRLQRLATREQRRTAIEQELHDALDALESSWQRILAARQQVRSTTRTLDAEQRQFDVGVRTSTDVLDAAFRLADARSREVRALADYQIAKVDLAFATGTLLGQDRVRWQPTDAARGW